MRNSYKKSNFATAFFFLTKKQRAALADFYAFCRIVDDIADEPHSKSKEELDMWRAEINKPKSDLAVALAQHAQEFNINKKLYTDIIDGMEMDLNNTVYTTEEDLKVYLYRVASAVGLAAIQIFGYKNERTRDYAVILGYAVQLTNIIRDIFEDYDMGRIYFPAETLSKFSVTPDDIKNKNFDKLSPLLAAEGAKAEEFYAAAEQMLPAEDKKTMLPARIMAEIYKTLLLTLKKNNFVFTSKPRLGKMRKLFIAAEVLLK